MPSNNNISFCQAAIVQHDIVSIFILFSLELHKTQKKVELKQVFARLYKSLRGRGYIQLVFYDYSMKYN